MESAVRGAVFPVEFLLCLHVLNTYLLFFFFTVDPPKIIQHPESKSVATGADITMTVQATGDDLHYQWQKDGIDLSDDDRHHDTGTDTLRIVKVEKGDSKRYWCHVKNKIGEEFSKEALLKVGKLVIVVDDMRFTCS